MSSAIALHAKAADLGMLACRMTALAGSGHPSTALSLAHIAAQLYYRTMRWDPADPFNPNADRLVLSEGHAVPIAYAALADLGAAVGRDRDELKPLDRADVDELRARDSVLDGHPNPAEGVWFFDAATGSLGMGLSVSAGLALAARLDQTERRIFCLVGDGEAREGQIWEAADFIVDHRLKSVCAVFNCNGDGQADKVSLQQSAERLAAKLTAFGWEVMTIDGHNPVEIEQAFARVGQTEQPLAIVAKTVKGWGVTGLQGGNWHGKPLKEADLKGAEQSLANMAASLGDSTSDTLPRPTAPTAKPVKRSDPREVRWEDFEETMTAAGMDGALAKDRLATRRAYGATLQMAGGVLPQLAVLDADVSNSTFSEMFAAGFKDRFFECKIGEQNMISVAAGLSAAGYIPVCNSFAKFLSRGFDQVELASISRANIKLVGSHSGVSLAADGPSQMGLLDVAFFRAFTTVRGDDRRTPLCRLYQPADAVAAYHLTKLMLTEHGMAFMRTHRPDVPVLYKAETSFVPGGFHQLATGDALTIITSGYMVHACKEALNLLAAQNLRVGLIDAYTLPIDGERLLEALPRGGNRVLVVEDNYGGGFGSAVAEIAARAGGNLRVATLTCQRIPKSTRTAEEALEWVGMSPQQVADHALALVREK